MADKEEVKEVKVKPNLENYVKGVSGSGKRTMRSKDIVAESLDGFTVEETYRVAAELTDTPVKDLQTKYGHLNVGMQRMNLGNRIRGAIAKQDKAREKDKSVANGLKLLQVACGKPREAADKRATAKAAKVKEAEAKKAAAEKAEKGKAKAA